VSFFKELKRRNVLRVGAAYAVVSWLLIQIAETIFPLFGFDETPARIVVVMVAIGFIPSLVLAWVFEWTPEGFRRESAIDPDHGLPGRESKQFDRFIMAGLALTLVYFAFDKFVLEPGRKADQVQTQAERLAAAAEVARQEGRAEALAESFGENSIAVLPFADMSPESDQEYLSDGIAEELLNLLSQVPGLRVTSRTSAFALKGQALGVPEIARRLKVGHILEGSVRKAGKTIRITAQLVEAQSDTHLWSKAWDREFDNVFAIQDEIAAQVVSELRVQLLQPAPVSETTRPEVLELVFKGRFLVSKRGQENLKQAEALFDQAIKVDANYAPAYAGLAKALLLQSAFGWTDSQAAHMRASVALDRALELEPANAEALASRGLMFSKTNIDRAREYYQLAIDANVNSSDAYRWLGLSYSYSADDPGRYLDYILRGYLVDPLNPGMNMNRVLALARFGQFEEALAASSEWHDVDPSVFPYVLGMADTYLAAGRITEAIKTCYASLRMEPEENASRLCIGQILFDFLEEFELAEAWIEAAGKMDPGDPVPKFLAIAIAYLRGDQERAMHLLTALEQNNPELWVALGRAHVIVSRDFAHAREIWERGSLEALDSQPRYWEPNRIIDYAMALQRTGDRDRADELIAETLARIKAQISAGLVGAVGGGTRLYVYEAALHALQGSAGQAVAALRDGIRSGGASCLSCLHGWPQFESLRGDPGFDAVVAGEEERVAELRRELREQHLLLSPNEVLSLEDWDFDPFEPEK